MPEHDWEFLIWVAIIFCAYAIEGLFWFVIVT